MNIITWPYVESLFEKLGVTSTDSFELNWFHQVWNKINDRGLANYSNEIELHIVYVKLLALLKIYDGFNQQVNQQQNDVDYRVNEFIYELEESELEVNNFRLGQIAHPKSYIGDLDYASDLEIKENALSMLADDHIPQLELELIKIFRSKRNFLTSIWCASRGLDIKEFHPSQHDILMGDFAAAYDYIENMHYEEELSFSSIDNDVVINLDTYLH